MIDVLVYRLLQGEDHHEAISKRRNDLKWAANCEKREDSEYYKILDVILAYDAQHGQCPPNKKAICEFVKTSEEHELRMGWSETILAALKDLNDIDEVRRKAITDVNVLIDRVVKEARIQFFLFGADYVAGIVVAGPTKKVGKFKDPSGCDDAKAVFYKLMARDLKSEAAAPAGILHEHVDEIAATLDEKLQQQDTSGRIKIGFPHVDNNIIIGKKNLRFVGILGMSGDGKTTILNTIVYNILCGGHNVLYVSLEHDPQEIWEFMAFLHSSHDDYEFQLPPLTDWDLANDPESGKKVTQWDISNMSQILRDIRDRRNLPGLLDVQQFRDWESIVAHLETNHKEKRYDVLVVDYLARLDVGGDQRFRDQEIKNIIHKAQSVTRSFDENRGLVLISPMQVNRQGNKAANAAEESGTRYDLNSISNFSEYQHDMDYIFSVWSDSDMKDRNELEMQTIKRRKGKKPPLALLKIDANSGYVCTFSGPSGPNIARQADEDDLSAWEIPAENDVIDEGLM
jgi:KaiC/GvpD/RAD55 family RecA-like ATPase